MGRYYKTANPQTLDFMYKLPEQYMFAAVQQASKDITENQAAMYDLYGKLQLSALSKDKARAKQILAGYEDSINEIAAELQTDPLSFRRKGGDLLGLSRKMNKDFTRGEAAAIQSNYNIDAEWQKDYDKAAREGKLGNANWIPKLRESNLEKYQGVGYNSATGNYNQYNPENLVNNVEIDEILSKKAKEIEPQVRAWAEANVEMVQGADGKMIRETAQTTEKRTKDRILEVVSEYFRNDPNIQAYTKQGSEIGMLSGYYNKDEEGNLKQISPYILNDKGQLGFNPESAAAQKFQSIMTTYEIDNIKIAKNVLKNLTASSEGSNASKSTMLPATINGQAIINPVAYLNGSNTPVEYAKATATTLTNKATEKELLSKAFEPVLETLDKSDDGDDSNDIGDYTDEKTIAYIQTLGDAIIKNDIEGLSELLSNPKINIPVTENLKNAVKGIQENRVHAYNINSQVKAYENTAAALLAKGVNEIELNGKKVPVTADNLMKQPQNFTQLVLESTGDYYDLIPGDIQRFNSILVALNKKLDDSYKLGTNKIIWEQDSNGNNTVREITNKDYLELIRPTEQDKRGKGLAPYTPDQGNMAGGDINGELSSGNKGLNPTGKIGNDIQMVRGEMAYAGIDVNGKSTGTQILKQPFTKKINTLDGKVIILVQPRETVGLKELEYFNNNELYKAKVDFEIKTERANNMMRGIREMVKDYKININVPSFKFNESTTFTPNVTGGLGTYRIKGITDPFPENMHSYSEYQKTMR